VSDKDHGAAAVSSAADAHPEGNQDSYILDPDCGVAAVFDGMGGTNGGAIASQTAAASVSQAIDMLRPDGQTLQDALRQAQSRLQRLARIEPSLLEMGTTAVLACVQGDQATVCWVGDSRAYLATAEGELRRLTVDHDLVDNDVRIGQLERAAANELHELLDDAGGSDDALDRGGPAAQRAFTGRNQLFGELMFGGPIDDITLTVQKSDLVILTSDGIHDNLTQQEMTELVAAARVEGDDQVAAALVEHALNRSRSDHGRAKPDDLTAVTLTAAATR
jgi:protein phosphatase